MSRVEQNVRAVVLFAFAAAFLIRGWIPGFIILLMAGSYLLAREPDDSGDAP